MQTFYCQATKHHSVGKDIQTPWLPDNQGLAGTVSHGVLNTLEWLRGKGVHPLFLNQQQSLLIHFRTLFNNFSSFLIICGQKGFKSPRLSSWPSLARIPGHGRVDGFPGF